ncbi:MAG: DUF393 domain-containing protein [Pseudomonadota bacterium]
MNSDFRVYYDGKCPVCVAEIEELQKADWEKSLDFVDCACESFADPDAAKAGITQSRLLRAMHVRSKDGQWYRGADAFAEVYGSLNMDRVARFWASPAGTAAYRTFLAFRPLLKRLGVAHVARRLVRYEARRARTG